jgi:hypothetical protein
VVFSIYFITNRSKWNKAMGGTDRGPLVGAGLARDKAGRDSPDICGVFIAGKPRSHRRSHTSVGVRLAHDGVGEVSAGLQANMEFSTGMTATTRPIFIKNTERL